MKLFLIVIIIKLFIIFNTVGQMFFYTPSKDEVIDMMEMQVSLKYMNNLNDYDKLKKNIDFPLTRLVNHKSIKALLFENFFYSTNNHILINVVSDYFIEENIKNNFSNTIINISKAKLIYENRYLFKDENNKDFYLEPINLGFLKELYFFNNKFGVLTLENNWMQIQPDSNTIRLYKGMGTIYITIEIKKNKYMELNGIISGYKNKEYNIIDVNIDGYLKESGANKIQIGSKLSDDKMMKSGDFIIFLINTNKRQVYSLDYEVKIFKESILINNSERIFNFFYMLLNLAYIN